GAARDGAIRRRVVRARGRGDVGGRARATPIRLPRGPRAGRAVLYRYGPQVRRAASGLIATYTRGANSIDCATRAGEVRCKAGAVPQLYVGSFARWVEPASQNARPSPRTARLRARGAGHLLAVAEHGANRPEE